MIVRDPVCKMDVESERAEQEGLMQTHAGHTYHFCSEDCRAEFKCDPVAYASHVPHHEDEMGAYTNE